MNLKIFVVNSIFMTVLAMGNIPTLTAGEKTLSLADAVRLTMANNPQFSIYQLRADGLAGEAQSAKLNPAIRISGEIENLAGTGNLNRFQGAEFTLALSRVIEVGDKRAARTGIVSQRQNLLRAEQQVFELELLADVTVSFINIAIIEQRQELLARRTALAAETLAQVVARVNAGRAADAEQSRAAADLALAQMTLQSAEYTHEAALVELSVLWGELVPQFSSVDADLLSVNPLPPLQVVLQQLQKNPAIEVFASESRVRAAELREVQSRVAGDIEVSAGIRHLAELNDTAFTLGISAPLGSGARQRGALTTAQANLLRADAEKELALLKMSGQVTRLIQLHQAALNEFNSLQNSVIPQLRDALNSTRLAFDNGRYSYLELISSQTALLDAEQMLIDAASRAHMLRVDIERFSGELLDGLTLGAVTVPEGVAQ